MRNETFDRAISKLLERDNRYPRAAYELLPEILDYTVRNLQIAAQPNPESTSTQTPHLSGAQLAYGFRDYILSEYAPFADVFLESLNIHCTEDIGNIVYNLISVGWFAKSDTDRLEDFKHVYDFNEAFVEPFAVNDPEYREESIKDENGLA